MGFARNRPALRGADDPYRRQPGRGFFLFRCDQVDSAKRDVTEKFFGYFRLLDACARSGCPVCSLVEDDGRRYLGALLYEQVTDPDTRRRIRAAWGFCNWHTWMLLEVPNAASGAAILYEDLVRISLDRIRRMRDGTTTFVTRTWSRLFARRRRPTIVELRRRRRSCPACAWVSEAEARYLATLTRFVDDPQLARAHASSDGLCAPHLLAAVELSSGTVELGRLLDLTMLKWNALRRDLEGFVGKHDYRNRVPFTDAEASSYRRAFEMMAGRQGAWGSDLHDREAATLAATTIADLRAENERLRSELASARDAARGRPGPET